MKTVKIVIFSFPCFLLFACRFLNYSTIPRRKRKANKILNFILAGREASRLALYCKPAGEQQAGEQQAGEQQAGEQQAGEQQASKPASQQASKPASQQASKPAGEQTILRILFAFRFLRGIVE